MPLHAGEKSLWVYIVVIANLKIRLSSFPQNYMMAKCGQCTPQISFPVGDQVPGEGLNLD